MLACQTIRGYPDTLLTIIYYTIDLGDVLRPPLMIRYSFLGPVRIQRYNYERNATRELLDLA